jgi:hypothetical protein
MPILATPFEQEVVADALKATGPDTVAPLAGELTVTPANAAGAPIASRHTINRNDFGMLNFSELFISFQRQNCGEAPFTHE